MVAIHTAFELWQIYGTYQGKTETLKVGTTEIVK